jgi:hypothetical protein
MPTQPPLQEYTIVTNSVLGFASVLIQEEAATISQAYDELAMMGLFC